MLYQGLYDFFERLKEKYPHVIFENCSSGGLRTDFALLEKCHVNFLSDPDYPVHKLRCIENATDFIHPRRLLHFVPSQTIIYENGSRPFENTDFSSMSDESIRYHMRLGMMTQLGLSHRLVDYDQRIQRIIKEEIDDYKMIRPALESTEEYTYIRYLSYSLHYFRYEKGAVLFIFNEGQVKRLEDQEQINQFLKEIREFNWLEVDTKISVMPDEQYLTGIQESRLADFIMNLAI